MKPYKTYIYDKQEEYGLPEGFEVRVYKTCRAFVDNVWRDCGGNIGFDAHGVAVESKEEYYRMCRAEGAGAVCSDRTYVSLWFSKNYGINQKAYVIGHEIGHVMVNQDDREKQADQYGYVSQMVYQLLAVIKV